MIATPLNELPTASVGVSLVNCICNVPHTQWRSGGDLLTRKYSVLPLQWQKDQGDFSLLPGVQLCWVKLNRSAKDESLVVRKIISPEKILASEIGKAVPGFPWGKAVLPKRRLYLTSNYPSLSAFTLPVYLASFTVKMFLAKCQKIEIILHYTVAVC